MWPCRSTRPARHADRQPQIAATAQQPPLRQPAAQCPTYAALGSAWSCVPRRRSGWSLCSGGLADRRRGVRAAEAPSETAPTTPQGGYLSDIIAFEVRRASLKALGSCRSRRSPSRRCSGSRPILARDASQLWLHCSWESLSQRCIVSLQHQSPTRPQSAKSRDEAEPSGRRDTTDEVIESAVRPNYRFCTIIYMSIYIFLNDGSTLILSPYGLCLTVRHMLAEHLGQLQHALHGSAAMSNAV